MDLIDVDRLIGHDEGITLQGKMPVQLSLSAIDPVVTATADPEPFEIRRIWGWRAV